jgi:hypothetical protein
LKQALKERFTVDEDVIDAVQNWLNVQPQNAFFLVESKKFEKRWVKCFEVEGLYVEEWCTFHFYLRNTYKYFKNPLLFEFSP